MEISLGGFTLTKPAKKPQRIALLLWGDPGCGKTTLAATAPGTKLWINFDPDGTVALNNRDDVLVLDFAGERSSIIEKFKGDNPLGLNTFFTEHPEIETVVIDSVTEFGTRALLYGVTKFDDFKGKKPTFEQPQLAGYGMRNSIVYQMVMSMLKITAKHNKHIIFITHEDVPTMDSSGSIKNITMMLGGKLNTQVPLQLSEVWHVMDVPKKGRLITIRPYGLHKPMKTRMFLNTSEIRFKWDFNADNLQGDGIETWYNQWKENGWKKINVPNNLK